MAVFKCSHNDDDGVDKKVCGERSETVNKQQINAYTIGAERRNAKRVTCPCVKEKDARRMNRCFNYGS